MSEPTADPNRTGPVAFAVIPLRRRRRRRLDPGLLVIGLAAVLVIAGLTQPWASRSPDLPLEVPVPGSPSLAAGPTGGPVPSTVAGGSAGHWAIGVGALPDGLGLSPDATPLPWMYGQIVWSAWRAMDPRLISPDGSSGDFAATASASELCTGLPSLPSQGRVVAVVAPPGRSGEIATTGWAAVGFRDDPPVIGPIAAITGLRVHRSGDITYLSLANAEPWPDGRYEFRVQSDFGLLLAACLGQP